ncbi:hypothetical protein GGI20_002734 [Coemansia sp. BCRC 34301]|nr:hypothetical protein GGI20_002734 [Coemansia sp. BCRC 34301]
MVRESTMSTVAKWKQISKVLGRSISACRNRFTSFTLDRKQDMDGGEHPATDEARKQLESGSSAVDWSQVSQATGLGFRECLEQSQYDVDKACWHYSPDSFLQSTVDRMTSFIEEHYPAPTPVNYRAVSNYLWIDIDNCIRIHDVLQGKFKWTKAAIERAVDLSTQGQTYREIARRLSPTLSGESVHLALKRQSGKRPAIVPISADEKEEMRRPVDDYAGKYLVAELITKIRTQLGLSTYSGYHFTLAWLITAHSYYQAKLRSIDFNDLASRIASGQTTAKLATKELDIPQVALKQQMQSMSGKLYSSRWSEETRKLVEAPVGSAIGLRHVCAHPGATNKRSADVCPVSLFSDCDAAVLIISSSAAAADLASLSIAGNDRPNTTAILSSTTNIQLGDNTAADSAAPHSTSNNTISTIDAKTQPSPNISSVEGSTDIIPSTNINKAITTALHSNASDNCTVDVSFGDAIGIGTSSVEKDDASTTNTSDNTKACFPHRINANGTNTDSPSNSRSEANAANPSSLHVDTGIEQLVTPSDSDIEAWERRWDVTTPLFYDIEWRTSDPKARWQECHRSYSEPAIPAEAHYDREWAKDHSKPPVAIVKRHSRSHSLNSLVNNLAEVDAILIEHAK